MANVHDVAKRLHPEMAVASVHKGQSISCTVPDLRITTHSEVPHGLTAEQVKRIFINDARQIADALHESLPGGTFEHVLRLMLELKASELVVPSGTTI